MEENDAQCDFIVLLQCWSNAMAMDSVMEDIIRLILRWYICILRHVSMIMLFFFFRKILRNNR